QLFTDLALSIASCIYLSPHATYTNPLANLWLSSSDIVSTFGRPLFRERKTITDNKSTPLPSSRAGYSMLAASRLPSAWVSEEAGHVVREGHRALARRRDQKQSGLLPSRPPERRALLLQGAGVLGPRCFREYANGRGSGNGKAYRGPIS